MTEKNYGLLIQEREEIKDYRMGGLTGLDKTVLVENGDWEPYLPVFEKQNNFGFDRMACVTYANLNCIEMLYKRLTGNEINESDRFTAKFSGTTHQGNYLRTVAENIRLNWTVLEAEYPDNAKSWEEYYKELPLELIEKASKGLEDFELRWEWVDTSLEGLREALKYSPVEVTVKYGSTRYNHCITLYSANDVYKCFDHYTGREEVVYNLDYKFGHAMRFELKVKNAMKNPLNLKNNTLVQLVEGKGGVGLYLDGAIHLGDLSKVHFTWDMRTKLSERDELKTALTQAQWDSYDFKLLP